MSRTNELKTNQRSRPCILCAVAIALAVMHSATASGQSGSQPRSNDIVGTNGPVSILAAKPTSRRSAGNRGLENSYDSSTVPASLQEFSIDASPLNVTSVQPGRVTQAEPMPAAKLAESNVSGYLLDQLIEQAMFNHPAIGAATARIDAAQQEALQAGLYPNPQLGLIADEVGNDDDPGLIGVYLQRNIIRGQKLQWSREVKNREVRVLENQLQAAAIRIETDVRSAFYRVVIAQKKLKLTRQLFESQKQALEQAKKLFEAGETPKTDLLQTELQAQQTNVLIGQTEVELQNAWRKLTVVVGNTNLPYAELKGSLDEVVETIQFDTMLARIIELSPELKSAHAEVDRVKATIQRAIAETVPNYQTQVRVGKDSSSEHFFAGVQLQVPLMICDRNQGNIAAAKSRLVEANNEVERIKRQLAQRLTDQFQVYQAAAVKTELYHSRLLPQARRNLELLTSGYPEEVEFLQVLSAQQTIVQFTLEYLDSLNNLWASRLSIEGLLLDESLSD